MEKAELDNLIEMFINKATGVFKLINQEVQNHVFNNLNLNHGLISKCVIKNCTFNNVKLYDTNLSETIFENCIFNNCDLSDSVVFRTEFNNSTLIRSRLIKVDSLDTHLKKTNFIECDFKLFDFGSAIIEECQVIDPENLDLGRSGFSDSILTKATN